ncbi:MAG: tyrosine-type recombinase/integrase [Lentisphaerae bacterium]|nr:tyrosine-type recombinase/integrase [Lentisphaerota bacterium]
MKPITAKRKRAKRGTGRLYKVHAGREYPADWKGPGEFWLAYTLSGERIIKALTTPDGTPITDRESAERERLRTIAPTLAADKVQTLRQIQEKLTAAQTELATATSAATPGVPIGDAWQTFAACRTRPDSGDATLRQYRFQWQRFATWLATAHPEVATLRDVSPNHAEAYAHDLGNAGITAGTANKHVALVRLVFRHLAKAASIVADPWAGIMPRKHRARGRREFTREELVRVCESASGELRTLLALGVYAGLRLADAATLRWTEVDWKRNLIARVPSKTARTSGKLVRIPLHPTLRAMLEAALTTGAEYVLPGMAADYAADRTRITDAVQRHLMDNGIDVHAPGTGSQIIREASGLPVRDDRGHVKLAPAGKRAVVAVGFHSLRHTFVSMCSEAGTPLSTVQALVGHGSPAMTRHYQHTSEGEAARAVAAIPALVGGDVKPKREPLPAWARALIEGMSATNMASVKAALLQ